MTPESVRNVSASVVKAVGRGVCVQCGSTTLPAQSAVLCGRCLDRLQSRRLAMRLLRKER